MLDLPILEVDLAKFHTPLHGLPCQIILKISGVLWEHFRCLAAKHHSPASKSDIAVAIPSDLRNCSISLSTSR